MIKKILTFAVIFLFGILAINFIFAQSVSYCCEKTIEGVWCMDSPQEKCETRDVCEGEKCKSHPTSCESTSYCKLGCCYDSHSGECSPNTPQKTCNVEGGVWENNAKCEIPQCEIGCCILPNQAFPQTLTACKRISAVSGVQTNFRSDIKNEFECMATVTSDIIGACVFEKEFEKTCRLLTQKECKEMESISENSDVSFHQGYLCSAEKLGTICGPSEQTTCVEGKEEVYFLDTCGNLANIYDSSKIKDKDYWSRIYTKSESCKSDSSNANSATCGNCNYDQGSTCKTYSRVEGDAKPRYGDNICRDLSCDYNGDPYQHGEKWCAFEDEENKGVDDNIPGSRHFVLECRDGEINVIPCEDKRAQVCMEIDVVPDFINAACVVNKWQTCTAQNNSKDCLNTDKRDCDWIEYEGKDALKIEKCIPKYAPGLDLEGDTANDEAREVCSAGTITCVVKYEKPLWGSGSRTDEKFCVENCHCLEPEWKEQMNQICTSLGDCGVDVNYLNDKGYHIITDLWN